MNYQKAAFLDLFLARQLLKLASLIPPYPKQLQGKVDVKKLLIMKFWGVGSIIEATPLFRTLKLEFPHASIDILTFSENREIISSLGIFHNIHVLDIRKGWLIFFTQAAGFIIRHRNRYSLIIDLEFFAYFSALMTKILNSEYALGFGTFFVFRNRCYSRNVVFDHSNHIRLIFLKFLNALDIRPPGDMSLSKSIISEEKKRLVLQIFPVLEGVSLKVAININSSELCRNRSWPEENFRRLIILMQADNSELEIYLSGGKDDVPKVKRFYDLLPNKRKVFFIAGKLDILEFSFFLSRMDWLITSDSGPLHIAESVGTPVISFFGPETPNLYGPLLKKSFIFYKNLYCSPCLNTYNHKRTNCADNQCLKMITVEDVYRRIKTMGLKP